MLRKINSNYKMVDPFSFNDDVLFAGIRLELNNCILGIQQFNAICDNL